MPLGNGLTALNPSKPPAIIGPAKQAGGKMASQARRLPRSGEISLRQKNQVQGTKVLIVDDDPAIVALLRECLEAEGYEAVTAGNGREGLRQFFDHRPNLVVLDVLMPEMDGLELCRCLREVSAVPILFLSGKGAEMDKVQGLDIGGDGYLTKPFLLEEFVARVKAILRRAQRGEFQELPNLYRDEALTIDLARREVSVRGVKTPLTPLEYKLLVYLVQRSPEVLSPALILKAVWGSEYESPDLIPKYILQLQQKIEKEPENPRLIRSVNGLGYRYEKPAGEKTPRTSGEEPPEKPK